MGGFARFLRRNTIALLALFITLSGTTYAAATALAPNSVGAKQVINGSLQTKDLSRKARKALKGNRGPRGRAGATGARGVPGTAKAYVRVFADGSLDTAHTKNVTSVGHPTAGTYCINVAAGLTTADTLPVAVTDFSGAGPNTTAQIRRTNGDCAANQLEVITYLLTVSGANVVATRTDEAFFAVVP
jgi:hypothetical protein